MTFLYYLVGLPVALVVLYYAARFIFTAYFRSKKEFEEWRKKYES